MLFPPMFSMRLTLVFHKIEEGRLLLERGPMDLLLFFPRKVHTVQLFGMQSAIYLISNLARDQRFKATETLPRAIINNCFAKEV